MGKIKWEFIQERKYMRVKEKKNPQKMRKKERTKLENQKMN